MKQVMTKLELALIYLSLFWSIIPIRVGSKIPHVKWKEFQNRRPTENEVRQWLSQWPDANIGMVTGSISNIVVFDADTIEAVIFVEDRIENVKTLQVRTGRENGGKHFLFKCPDDLTIKNDVNKDLGLDIRGDKGIVVLPPSIHKSGKKYRWVKGCSPWNIAPTELPESLIDYYQERKKDKSSFNLNSSTFDHDFDDVMQGVDEGERNVTIFKFALKLFHEDFSQEDVIKRVIILASNCNPPFPFLEAMKIVISAERYVREKRH